MTAPLHQLDPLNRFSDRAADYVNHRPSYPPDAIAQILSGLGNPSQLIVADIGAGTGISSRLFGERGCRVWAIEPNVAMQASAEPHLNVEYHSGTAEQTGLTDQSVNLVTCFQAFHWFNPEVALTEFHRILKPSGRLALAWNSRDRSDPFTNEFGELMRQASDKHPALDRAESFPDHPLFPTVQDYRFTITQAHDLAGLIGNAKSRSYVPRAGAAYEKLLNDLKGLYDRYADPQGRVFLKYQTTVFIADLLQ
ncbi:MAG: class I SAM-dependent methyltransferase [Myxacorys chilensis ATA2-1-KO14]|jgi:SAM-dependent methyltransferase|nr:class I SAM-dependent methyltransferase [Myxacorys chilensis ATA2-1-KO14]